VDGNDGDAYGREPHPALSPEQFADFIGPLGSFGDPNGTTGYYGVGTMAGAGAGI
jgi:hypothetical protein